MSAELEQGAEVARLVITDADGRLIERPIRAGIETAEWAYDRAEVRAVVRHERPEPVAKHIGNLRANYYLARWEFDPPVDLASARVYYRAPLGDLYVDGIAMRRPMAPGSMDRGSAASGRSVRTSSSSAVCGRRSSMS